MIIYALFDEATPDNIRYVGQTKLTLRQRIGNHIKRGRKSHTVNWIRSVENQGRRVNGKVLAIVESSQVDETEVRAIALFLSRGFDLTNATSGGEAGKVYNEKTRQQMSASAKKRCTPEWREASRLRAMGREKSPEEIERWKISNFGKHKMSDAVKLNTSHVQKGRKRSPEELEKQRIAQTGKVQSEETRRKNSESNKGRIKTPEHLQRMAAGIKLAAARRKQHQLDNFGLLGMSLSLAKKIAATPYGPYVTFKQFEARCLIGAQHAA